MKTCKCENECASNAKTCPKCGYRFTSTFTKFCLVFFGLVILRLMFVGHSSSSSSSMGSSSAITLPTAASAASSPAPSVEPKDILLRSVKLDSKWRKKVVDFTLNNPTEYRFKDLVIKCTQYSPSGTVIDSETRMIKQLVQPNRKTVMKNVDMGFIPSQVKSSSCNITDLTYVSVWGALYAPNNEMPFEKTTPEQ